jgi:arylsulfatase
LERIKINYKENKPNILWICTDSQRFDTLGCYGNPYVKTPNIDKLAGEGVLFENAFAQNPLCTPSRGCFLTGRYPVTMGLRQNGQNIKPTEKLVTKLLAEAGYVCGLSGKLHLSACDNRIKRFGRDEWWRYEDNLYFSGIEPRIDDGYTEFYWDHEANGRYPSSAYARWVQEKGQEIRYPERDDCKHVHHGMKSEYHQTAFCVEKAVDFIKAYKESPDPWLFSVNIYDPHFDFNPPEEYLKRYLDKLEDIPLPDYEEGELEDKPYCQKEFSESGRHSRLKLMEKDHRMMKAAYWAMIDHIDVQIGRLLEALESSGQKDNTIVIFTSDHGELLGDHGMYHKGPFLYDAAIHVPLIISYPALIEGGRRSTALVELGDIAPTLLEAAGLPRYAGMQTSSLWSYLVTKGELGDFREDVYCEYYNSNPVKPAQYCTMVRTDKYKLIAFHGQELGELYDLEKDPKEFQNLWKDAEYTSIKLDMLKRLCDRMAITADPLPERIGIY